MSSNEQTERNLKNPVVAIAGATGAVGVELMQCLEQRKFPLVELRLLASARSVGKSMKFRGSDLPVQELTDASLEGVDIALFSAGGAQSKQAPAPPALTRQYSSSTGVRVRVVSVRTPPPPPSPHTAHYTLRCVS